MGEFIRSFIGIPLTPSVSNQISDQLGGLKSLIAPGVVRWQVQENHHLTLQFIGGVEPQTIVRISQALEHVVQDSTAFDLTLTEIACFPDAKSVVVAALAAPERPLLQLVEKIGRAMELVDISSDSRRFRPHITLGRIKQRPLELAPSPLGLSLSAERIALYQSDTTPGGAIYSVLADFPLGS